MWAGKTIVAIIFDCRTRNEGVRRLFPDLRRRLRALEGADPAIGAATRPRRLTVITDAWHPQVNGVVRSIENTNRELAAMGIEVSMVTPVPFASIPMPTYPEIRLSLATPGQVARMIERQKPDYVHIATEGPLGLMARRWCLKTGMPSRPPITRAFRNMSRRACPCRCPGSMPMSAGFITVAAPAWWPQRA